MEKERKREKGTEDQTLLSSSRLFVPPGAPLGA